MSHSNPPDSKEFHSLVKSAATNMISFFQKDRKNVDRIPKTVIIKDGEDDTRTAMHFEQELERALYEDYDVIIIEPKQLAEETIQWIQFGNYLSKIAVIGGITSLCINASANQDLHLFSIPSTAVSVICAGLYMISWQFDPCCKYQEAKSLEKINTSELSPEALYYSLLESNMQSSSPPPLPLTIIKKDDTCRKIFHTTIAAIALSVTIYRVYKKGDLFL